MSDHIDGAGAALAGWLELGQLIGVAATGGPEELADAICQVGHARAQTMLAAAVKLLSDRDKLREYMRELGWECE